MKKDVSPEMFKEGETWDYKFIKKNSNSRHIFLYNGNVVHWQYGGRTEMVLKRSYFAPAYKKYHFNDDIPEDSERPEFKVRSSSTKKGVTYGALIIYNVK